MSERPLDRDDDDDRDAATREPDSVATPDVRAGRKSFFLRAAQYTAIATTLPGAVVGGYILGYALDSWLGTSYLKIVFLLLGVVGGFLELFRLLSRDMKTRQDSDKHAARKQRHNG